ncbi:Uncharacterized protein ALO80_04415 [Pseudomonas caricapapayae]|uniref:Phosphoenolpyruvate carboxykinase n=1 Tax=Pseudomonas caricapapayae TaxID=46678 RepID=A0A0P9K6M7_9PSED|nr:hypothetical protein [Pseudomonas caricapapayae]KPW59938.1 Uncharacterized protein ALO80_04415 [Pseudomonas caricapapayae]RMM06466.1 Phosphoenolpyruvate carboxykinase [Pseudomonas caricapapayae]
MNIILILHTGTRDAAGGLVMVREVAVGNDHFFDESAVLEIVHSANLARCRKLTSGQLYLGLVRVLPTVPAIGDFMAIIDGLVKEGLLISGAVLPYDPSFPYVQHIILGLTEPGEAALDR